MAEKKKRYKPFSRIDILVHPFFAVENARARGRTLSLIKTTPQAVLESYKLLGLIDAWKEKIREVQRNPNAMMIIVGPRAMAAETGRHFFEGQLTREALAQFTQEYQAFLRYAKRALGRRAIYMSQSIMADFPYLGKKDSPRLAKLLSARRYVPFKDLIINVYGELISKDARPQCVDTIAVNAENFFSALQKLVWKAEPTTLKVTKIHKVPRRGGGLKTLSIDHEDITGTEIAKELLRKTRAGKRAYVTSTFLRKNIRWKQGATKGDLQRVAKGWNRTWKKWHGKR